MLVRSALMGLRELSICPRSTLTTVRLATQAQASGALGQFQRLPTVTIVKEQDQAKRATKSAKNKRRWPDRRWWEKLHTLLTGRE